jgi:drug/metabolite transporter (DMT)-like permease
MSKSIGASADADSKNTATGAAAAARERMAAAATLKPTSRARWFAFILLAIVVQLSWGLFGVCTRYLQIHTDSPIPSLQLCVVMTVVSWAGLVIFSFIPTMAKEAVRALLRRRRAARATSDRNFIAKALAASNAANANAAKTAVAPHDIEASAATTADAAAADAKRAARKARLVSAAAATVIGTLVVLQGLALIYASRLTRAYIVQLVLLLTPLTTAVASRFFLRQPTPRALWPSLVAAIAGSALVVTGNWMSQGGANHEAAPGSARDAAAGLALAFVSMLLLAAYLLMLQVTQHIVTGVQVMWGNSYVGVLLLTPLALGIEGLDWSWVLRLSLFDWGVLAFAAFFIDAVNTIWTQHCSRVLGAAIVSLFISCRLVSSVVGSIILLHEVPSSPLTFAGFGVVGVALSGFMILQAWDKSKAAKQEAAAAAAEGGEEGKVAAAAEEADKQDGANRV